MHYTVVIMYFLIIAVSKLFVTITMCHGLPPSPDPFLHDL